MQRMLKTLGITLLVLVILSGFAGIVTAAFPVAITGYVGVNNTPGAPMVTPLSSWTVTLKKSPYTSTAATATTSSTGAYSLSVTSTMGAGTYRVYETVKTGYKNYTMDYAQFTVSSSSTGLKANFTNYQPPAVTLNGHKYQDPDGKHTSTATPLSGWTIQLNKSSGTKWSTLATATTDATGTYQFQVTDYGDYRVVEVEQAGFQKTWPATNYSQTIKGGQTGTITQDFWNQKLMSVKVSGHTYEDPDLAHTSTATPLAGWKVHLQNLSGTTWNEVASVTTAAGTGYYEFLNIRAPGSYRVLEDLQTGYQQSYPANGIITFSLDASSAAQTAEFWNYKMPGVVISGHAYLDPDGLHTSKASPLGSWKIHLQNLSGTTWNEVASAMTAAGTGYYEFPAIRVPGSYRILEDAVTGYSQSFPVSAYSVTIAPGQTAPVPDQDFWNSKLMNVRIAGHTFEDPDLTHTSTATPLKNRGMHLSLQAGSTWTEAGTAKTANDGSYEFTSITQPGHYRVWEDPDPSYRPGSPADGKIEFDLDAFSPDRTADFWDYRLPSVVITGYSYLDPDGQHTSKDTPLDGWEVKLLKGSGSPVTFGEIASAQTGKNGYYEFPPVTDIGNYQVLEVVQDGYAQTYPTSVNTILIAPGQTTPVPGQDFWNRKLMHVRISGSLYEDPDLTHSSTATPLRNRVMHLSILSGSPVAWTDIATATTDKAGSFGFAPVTQPGHYKVREDPDPAYKPSTPAGGGIEYDLDANSPDVSAGFWDYPLPNVVVWGYSYLDPDGQHSSTGTPLEGWELKLLKAEGDPVSWVDVDSVTTEKHGYYLFKPITDVGTYKVAEVVQEGYIQTYPAQEGTFLIVPGQAGTLGDQDFWNRKNVVDPDPVDPDPVPVPEFPTIAVSIFTILGMAGVVQILKGKGPG